MQNPPCLLCLVFCHVFWSFLTHFRPFLTLFKTPNLRFGFLFTLGDPPPWFGKRPHFFRIFFRHTPLIMSCLLSRGIKIKNSQIQIGLIQKPSRSFSGPLGGWPGRILPILPFLPAFGWTWRRWSTKCEGILFEITSRIWWKSCLPEWQEKY